MKRQVSNNSVAFMLSLLFMLGGLFIANDVQAQAHNLLQTQQPVTNWISPQQAMPVATVEVENLTAKVQQLLNNGADMETVRKAKTELLFYYTMLNSLQQGAGTEESFQTAWSGFGGSATAINSPFSIQEAEVFYNKAFDKFTD